MRNDPEGALVLGCCQGRIWVCQVKMGGGASRAQLEVLRPPWSWGKFIALPLPGNSGSTSVGWDVPRGRASRKVTGQMKPRGWIVAQLSPGDSRWGGGPCLGPASPALAPYPVGKGPAPSSLWLMFARVMVNQ